MTLGPILGAKTILPKLNAMPAPRRDPGLRAKCFERMAYYIMNDFRNQDKKPEEFIIPLPRCIESNAGSIS